MKNAKNLRVLLKVGIFLMIFLFIFQGLTFIFRTKRFKDSVGPIYDYPENSFDVIFLGSSHMNNTIFPALLWSEYGITSFNAAIGDQTIPASYFELRELLKVQHPKVVVLDMYHIWQADMMTSSGEERLHWLVDNIPMSLGVSEAIQTLISEESDKTEYYISFYSFHDRWKELTEDDFQPSSAYSYGANLGLVAEHTAFEEFTPVAKEETQAPPDLPLEYLHKIIDLCEKYDISLVLMNAPYYAAKQEGRQKQFNYIEQVAQEENVPYLNFLHMLEDIQFDFSKDMAESSHLNYYGAQKVTSYMGQYLQTHYDLTDYRNCEEIAVQWDQGYEDFMHDVCNLMIKTAEDMESYFSYIEQGNYTVMWSAYSKETPLAETCLAELIEQAGLSDRLDADSTYFCALTTPGRYLYQRDSTEKIETSYMLEDTLFTFGPGIRNSTKANAVHVGRTEYSEGSSGLNLVVYDTVTNEVVDAVNVNLKTMKFTR